MRATLPPAVCRRRPLQWPEVAERDAVDATRRTRLANERTFLAWLRSALTAIAVAIAAGKIVPGVAHVTRWPFELLGAGFVVLAVALLAVGAQRFVRVEEALAAGEFAPLRPRQALVLAAIAGVLMLLTLGFIFVR
jgi:putative membrane protein